MVILGGGLGSEIGRLVRVCVDLLVRRESDLARSPGLVDRHDVDVDHREAADVLEQIQPASGDGEQQPIEWSTGFPVLRAHGAHGAAREDFSEQNHQGWLLTCSGPSALTRGQAAVRRFTASRHPAPPAARPTAPLAGSPLSVVRGGLRDLALQPVGVRRGRECGAGGTRTPDFLLQRTPGGFAHVRQCTETEQSLGFPVGECSWVFAVDRRRWLPVWLPPNGPSSARPSTSPPTGEAGRSSVHQSVATSRS